MIKKILHYYILGFMMLMFYYLAEKIGLAPWVFSLPLALMLLLLTLWYGTGLLIIDTLLHKWMDLD